jgi:NAD-dependent dihydropyrimidine dehydrogenase PreA subunit
VKGKFGHTLLKSEGEEEEDEDGEGGEPPAKEGIVGQREVPDRFITCIDLRGAVKPREFVDEALRIANESRVQTFDLMGWIQGNPKQEQLERYLKPAPISAPIPVRSDRLEPVPPDTRNDRLQPVPGVPQVGPREHTPAPDNGNGSPPLVFDATSESAARRWYPVIDYSRCTNCMECIDFCLFGVYGLDYNDTILVEQQDNCKKGCPACSRVCPENAIIFPGHKTPAIAGAEGEVAALKIDLSKLFGAPDKTPLELAVAERDVELVRDGRDAVGMSVGVPRRRSEKPQRPRDELDALLDGLDGLNP